MEEELKKIIKEALKEVLSEMETKRPSEVLSVKELSEWLGVSPAWISVNKDKLHIPYFKCGGDKFYRTDIEKWIEDNKAKSHISIPTKTNIKVAKSKLKII